MITDKQIEEAAEQKHSVNQDDYNEDTARYGFIEGATWARDQHNAEIEQLNDRLEELRSFVRQHLLKQCS